MKARLCSFLALFFLLPILAACSEGDLPFEPPSDAQSSLEEVRLAVVQIVAEGTFRSPEEQQTEAGSGSGFIIDPSGIAVTNNHVVTGAGILKVYLSGEDAARNAKVLGVSECADLAVIDIEGDNFPYLEWHEGEINAGLKVYTAGFGRGDGDAEYTLSGGIVLKVHATAETDWVSVDSVIEHDATVHPGYSGGPLVDSDGRVVAVNYIAATTTNPYYALGADNAQKIISSLRVGENVTSIGLNGFAFKQDKEESESESEGIWVSSVKSGSPADKAGTQAGDLITELEGLSLASDGTMADYCNILRSHGPEDTITMQVLRSESQEVLEGQLNGRSLEIVSESTSIETPPTVTPTPPTATPTPVVGMGIDDLLDNGVLIAGVPENFPPFGYENENGNRAGFDVDIAREFAKRWLGDENAVEFKLVGGDQRFVSLEQAQAHLTIAAMTATFERCERVACSQTYFEDGARLLVHPDSGINSICDLESQYVAVKAGGTGVSNIQDEAPRWCDYTVPPAAKEYASAEDAFDAIKTGIVVAYTTDGIALEKLAPQNPPLIVVGDPFSSEPYSIAVAKQNEELLDLINFTLQEMKRDGTYDALSVRWFGCERTPFPIITDKGTPSAKIQELIGRDTPLEADTSCNPTPETYAVQRGDTLFGLSARFYGSGTLYQCIHDANWDTIGNDPRKLQPGMSLTIPNQAECSS